MIEIKGKKQKQKQAGLTPFTLPENVLRLRCFERL